MEPREKLDPENVRDADAELLRSLGYAQELGRRLGGFSNFAISFSIICILAGGITAFQGGLGAGGGASIGLGWPVGALFAFVVAAAMAQVASAFPTAGGLYHWASILGGRGFGWVTAWFNLLGLIFVLASVNFGVYDPFFRTLVAPLFGIAPADWTWTQQTLFIGAIVTSQAILNRSAVRWTSRLTDASGYLIFSLATLLTASLLYFSPVTFDLSRLTTFTNLTGKTGSWWPATESSLLVFLSGLLLTVYTITGFDASAHAAEETRDAALNVPKGILRAVFWSGICGYLMVATFVLVLPDVNAGVALGMGFFEAILSPLPSSLRVLLGLGLFSANYLCGLACLTSCSRMMYAFARDGGLPGSRWLKRVDPVRETPGNAVWVSAGLSFVATLYGDAFFVLATASAVLLYISYVLPSAAGFLAEGKSWTKKGPFDLGRWSKPVAAVAVLGGTVLSVVGMLPPNEKVMYLTLSLLAALAVFWWVFAVRRGFRGPPSQGRRTDASRE